MNAMKSCKARGAAAYRRRLSVSEIFLFRDGEAFPICPRCRTTLEREYQTFCDRCGQHLDWHAYPQAAVIRKP